MIMVIWQSLIDFFLLRVFSPNAGVEQVVLGLHNVCGDNIAVISEIDKELDKRWELSSVLAEPITYIVH